MWCASVTSEDGVELGAVCLWEKKLNVLYSSKGNLEAGVFAEPEENTFVEWTPDSNTWRKYQPADIDMVYQREPRV